MVLYDIKNVKTLLFLKILRLLGLSALFCGGGLKSFSWWFTSRKATKAETSKVIANPKIDVVLAELAKYRTVIEGANDRAKALKQESLVLFYKDLLEALDGKPLDGLLQDVFLDAIGGQPIVSSVFKVLPDKGFVFNVGRDVTESKERSSLTEQELLDIDLRISKRSSVRLLIVSPIAKARKGSLGLAFYFKNKPKRQKFFCCKAIFYTNNAWRKAGMWESLFFGVPGNLVFGLFHQLLYSIDNDKDYYSPAYNCWKVDYSNGLTFKFANAEGKIRSTVYIY